MGYIVGGKNLSISNYSAETESLSKPATAIADQRPNLEKQYEQEVEDLVLASDLIQQAEPVIESGLTLEEIETLSRESIRDPNPLKRSLALSRLLSQLTPSNAIAIQNQLRKMGAGSNEIRLFQYAWGAVDGLAATEYASTIENKGQRGNFIRNVVSGWATADPDAAIAFARLQDSGHRDDNAMRGLVEGLSDYNIDYATNFVYQLVKEGDERATRYLRSVSYEAIRSKGVVGATLWGDALPTGEAKASVLDRIANRYVDEDPVAAAKWAEKYADQDFAVRVIEEVGDEWAERDPESAIAWIETISEGPGKKEAMRSALNEWAQRDAVAASEYLVEMPDSATRDYAVNGFALRLSREDPESAVIWAETIADDGLRQQAITQAGRAWFRINSEAATQWLADSELPDEIKQQVQGTPAQRVNR
ncbi:MAG: hypothetical protein ACPGSB_06240 [Opitutales bacterium]